MLVPLIGEAQLVRNELELNNTIEGFCFEASIILGLRLQRYGLRPNFVCGYIQDKYGYFHGHYWLEINGNILDITGDQFNKKLEKPIPSINYGNVTDVYGVRFREPALPTLFHETDVLNKPLIGEATWT